MADSFENLIFGANPFPQGTWAHEAFAMASRKAAEERSRLVARLDLDDPLAALSFCAGYFDIVAKYTIPLVTDYKTAGKFERVLQTLRSSILDSIAAHAPGLRSEVGARLITAEARWLSEALAVARESEQEDAAEATSAIEPPMETTPWEVLSIEFLSDHKFQFRVADRVMGAANFAEAGFGDRRSREDQSPTGAWRILVAFAAKGTIPLPVTSKDRITLGKRVVVIRKNLRAFLAAHGLRFPDDDPLPVSDGQYSPRFRIYLTSAFRH